MRITDAEAERLAGYNLRTIMDSLGCAITLTEASRKLLVDRADMLARITRLEGLLGRSRTWMRNAQGSIHNPVGGLWDDIDAALAETQA